MTRWLAMACLAGLAACQTPEPEGLPRLAARDFSMADVQVVTSPGGVTAWLVEEDFVPALAMEMAWRGGTANEPADKAGVGWLLAYMMNEGAGDLDTTAYGARMEDLSMDFGCRVGMDWTNCGFVTLTATADESFEMVRMAFSDLRLDIEPFERAKRELAVGVAEEDKDPRALASRAMNKALIPDHPYARRPTQETVAASGKDDVRQLMQKVMTRDKLLVVVVGDISAAELASRLDEVFGALPQTASLPDIADAVARPAPSRPIVKELEQPQTLVMFSGPGITREDPDFYAAYVLNYILGGGGLSSRLADELREKRGLTYGVATGLSIQPHLARWTGSSSTMNQTAGETMRLVRENIGKLGRDGPTEQEMEDAKAYLTGAFPLAFDSNAKIARNLMGFRQDGMGVDYVEIATPTSKP
ncbi:MAG: pitrilysin family protein [Hyphomonadaceae bacterium]